MKVVHIADVHWRGLTRHDEYRRSFENMFEQCREINPDSFLIAGDIVHSKTQGISPELIDCLSWWFTEMSRIAPVHVMLGNHDGLILNSDRQDAISPILNALNISKIHLYKDSGVYRDPYNADFNWCIYSPFDEDGYSRVLPEKGKINIAVYHGAVWGSHTDSDWMLDGDTKMDLFRPFEFTMLGDIHKRQQIDKDGRIHYCGSTIQQNYGESGEKGFLLWDIRGSDDWDVEFFPVAHDNPFVTVEYKGNVQSTVKECMKFPAGARFRIRHNSQLDPKTQRKMSTVLRREHNADEVVWKVDHAENDLSVAEVHNKVKVENLDQPEIHKQLLREYASDESYDDDFWEEVDRIVDELMTKVTVKESRGNRWNLRQMNFDNTFGYGKENKIDFTTMSGIVGLFGKNRCGKSSIPGTIMYGLYNANDRGITTMAHVINTREDYCSADISFSVNEKLYRIERQSVRYKSRGKRSAGACTHLNLYEIEEDGSIIKDLGGEQRRDTEKTVRDLVGRSDDFMMTSFAAQGNMNAFISRGSTERKKILSGFLGLDIFDDVQTLVKEEASGIKTMLKRLEAKDWVTLIRAERQRIKALNERRDEIGLEIDSLQQKLLNFRTLAKKDFEDNFIDPQEIQNKETSVKNIRRMIQENNGEICNLEEAIDEINSRIERFETIKENFPLQGLKRKIDRLNEMNRSLAKMEAILDKESSAVEMLRKRVRILESVPCGDSFPTCRFIKDSHESKDKIKGKEELVESLRTEVSALKAQVQELEDQGLRNKLEKYQKMLVKESSERISLAEKEGLLNGCKDKTEHLLRDLSRESDKLAELKMMSDVDKSNELKKLKAKIASCSSELDSITSERTSVSEQIGIKQNHISTLERERNEYDSLQVEWKVYDFLLKATGWRGIPTYIMTKQAPVINAELSNILQDTVGFTVELEIDSNKTNAFINYGDSRRPIECASGMEKMVSSLALRVALTNVSNLNRSDMFIIDEGFGSLDPQNIEAVTSLLHSLKKYYRIIMIISHVDVVKDAVDEVIDITKMGKNSRVIYG